MSKALQTPVNTQELSRIFKMDQHHIHGIATCWRKRLIRIGCVIVLPLACLVFSGKLTAQDLSTEAQLQLQSLMEEKASRTAVQQKINSQIWYAYRMLDGNRITPRVASLRTGIEKDANGFIKTNITANVSAQLLNELTSLGCRIVISSERGNTITASIPLASVEQIAALPGIRYIDYWMEPVNQSERSDLHLSTNSLGTSSTAIERTRAVEASERAAMSSMLIGAVTSQGDVAHGADLVRATYGLSGAGIKIGVISDSYDNHNGAATNIAAGDLPGPANPFGNTTPVTVLSDYVQPDSTFPAVQTDEGRAMLQIVHDIAPAAELFFATAYFTEDAFAQAILDLRAAGCDIIVDDISYLFESVWKDGVIAEAVNTVTADGALYFSSAGNSGNMNDGTSGVWEGDFLDGGTLPLFPGGSLHDFGGGQLFNTLTSPGLLYLLTWSDPWGSGTNDYDLFVTNSTGTEIIATAMNAGTIPIEWISTPLQAGMRFYILKRNGSSVRALRLTTNRGRLSHGTSGATFGHNAAENTISVAATPAGFVGTMLFDGTASVETFSSDGLRKMFYHPDGTEITPGNLLFGSNGGITLQKPDITAADGVSTTVAGFDPFNGTSAAAPHAAAIAALIMEYVPTFSAGQIRDLLYNTAIDIEAPGVDRDAGRGVVMANAMESLGFSLVSTSVDEASSALNNANGALEPGEVGYYNFTLKNNTNSTLSNVHAILTSTTSGVTIINGDFELGSIPGSGSYVSSGQFRFVTTQGLPCNDALHFSLKVIYDGGILSPQSLADHTNALGANLAPIEGILGSPPPTGLHYTSSAGQIVGHVLRVIGPGSWTVLNQTTCTSGPFNMLIMGAINITFPYHAFVLSNQNEITSQCITVHAALASTGTTNNPYNVVVYNNAGFNPGDPLANIIGHGHINQLEGQSIPFSFVVPPGENYTVVVMGHSILPPHGNGQGYTLEIDQLHCVDVPCIATDPIVLSPESHVMGVDKFTGTVGIPFSQTFSQTGGSGLDAYYTSPANIPPGLTLTQNSLTATLSGIPTAPFGTSPNGAPWALVGADAPGCADPDANIYYILINPCAPVSISSPASNNGPICGTSGNTLSLSVGVLGQEPYTYEWSGPPGTIIINGNTATPNVLSPVSGDYSVTVTNYCGSVTSTTTAVVNTVPNIIVPGPFNLNTDSGQCFATLHVADLYSFVTVTGSPTPQLVFTFNNTYPTGMSTISANASNMCGVDQDIVQVVVSDNEPPMINSKNIAVELTNGSATITGADINNGSSDPCGIQSLSLFPQDPVHLNSGNMGSNFVTFMATDVNGNTSSSQAVVTVVGDLCPGGDDGVDTDGAGLPDDCDCSPHDAFNDKIILRREENTGMDFDGIDDHLQIPNAAAFNPTHSTSITFEAWIKPDLSNPFNTMISKGNGGAGQTAYIFDTYNYDNIALYLGASGGGGSWFYADSTLPPDTWIHVAVVYSHVHNTVSFYYNGTLVKSEPVPYTPFSGDTQPVFIGQQGYGCACNHYDGQMEELRIWSTARTGDEIRQFMDQELKGWEQNLIAYYSFNDGIPGGNNTALTFVSDQSPYGHDAGINGLAQNGAESNWILADLPLAVTNKDTLELCMTCPEESNTGMDFDGIDDEIVINHDPVFNPVTGSSFSFEAWIHPASGPVAQTILSKGNGSGGQTSYIFSIYQNKIALYMGNGTQANWIFSDTDVAFDAWNHVAVVYDGVAGNFTFYLNGAADGMATIPHGFFSDNSPVYLGRQGTVCDCNHYLGQMDEVRIWSEARSAGQIQSFRNNALYGSEPNLEAYYTFNNGVAEGNNSGITTLPDASLNGRDGTVVDFAKTGNTSNWVSTSFALPGPQNAAMDFDGSNDHITIPNHPDLIPTATNAITFEAWIHPGGDPGESFITASGIWPDRNHQIYLLGSSLWVTGTGVSALVSADTIPFHEWTHIAVVFDMTETRLYINGKPDNTRVQILHPTNLGFAVSIGNQASGIPSNWNFLGKMDDVRYWDHARTATDIAQDMYQELTGNEDGLTAYFNFNEGAPAGDNSGLTTVYDIANNGHDGTVHGFLKTGSTSNWVSSPFNFGDGDKDGLPDFCDNCIPLKTLLLEDHALQGIYRASEKITLGSGLTMPTSGTIELRAPMVEVMQLLPDLPVGTSWLVTPLVCPND